MAQQSCNVTESCDMPQTEMCMYVADHWDAPCWCSVLHHVAANYCLVSLLHQRNCKNSRNLAAAFRYMPAQKNIRLQAESILRNVTVQNRKNILSNQWKGVFLYEILGFFSLCHCGFDFSLFLKPPFVWKNFTTRNSTSIQELNTHKKMTKVTFKQWIILLVIMEEKVFWVHFLFDTLRENFYWYVSITDLIHKLKCNGNSVV